MAGIDTKAPSATATKTIRPRAFIRPEYVNHNVELKNGNALAGFVVEQGDGPVRTTAV